MFGRKKKQQDDPKATYGMTVPQATTPPGGFVVGGRNVVTAESLRNMVPGLMSSLEQNAHTINATTVSTTLSQDGRAIDPNSAEGQQLLATLKGLGVDLGALTGSGTTAAPGPTVAGPTVVPPGPAPTGSVPPGPVPTVGGYQPNAATAFPFPQQTPAPASTTPAVDQGAVALALQQAQSMPQRLPDMIALVDRYVHGQIGHDQFEAERRAIVGY